MNQKLRTTIADSDIADTTGRQSILVQIREGMDIYDVRDKHIGTVDFVHFGAASETQLEFGIGPAGPTAADNPQMRRDSIVENIAEAFDSDTVPEVLREKLLVSGYIRMDADGIFAADRFIMPQQIVRVEDEKVFLSVKRDQLVKRS